MSELYNLGNIVILKAGPPGVEDVTEADLQDMVDAFAELRQDIPIYAGKTVGQDAVRVGSIASLTRSGPILKANFEKLPKQVFDAIQNGWVTTIKAGLAVGVKSNGGKYRCVLEYISYPEIDPTTIRGTYKEDNQMKKTYANHIEAADDLDRQVKKYLFDHPTDNYREVMHRILDNDPELKKAYTQVGITTEQTAKSFQVEGKEKKYVTPAERKINADIAQQEAGDKLTELTKEYMKEKKMDEKNLKQFKEAFKIVAEQNPELKTAYVQA